MEGTGTGQGTGSGDTWQDATHGTDNQKYTGWNYTDYAEDHQHSVTIPPHKHSTSGKTADLGEENRSAWLKPTHY